MKNQLTVSDAVLGWMKDQLCCNIAAFYDDPYGSCDYPFGDEPQDKFPSPCVQIAEEHKFFQEIAQCLGEDFDHIVSANTSDYERLRINDLLTEVADGN